MRKRGGKHDFVRMKRYRDRGCNFGKWIQQARLVYVLHRIKDIRLLNSWFYLEWS